jgi:AmiR/NasT family two-component response regulator
VTALQAYAGVVASLLSAASKAQLQGTLAEQLQTALDSRGLIERAKGALMERERLDDQEAFTHLRRAARSSGRKLSEVAGEVAAGQPLPRWRTRPAKAKPQQPDGEAGTVQADT